VVLKPLPFDEADRLVSVWNAQPEKHAHEFPLSTPDYVDFRDGQQVFEALAAHTGTSVAVLASGEARQVAGVLTTADLFAVLRVAPQLGRPLTRIDSAPGAPAVIMIGDDFWRSEFGRRVDVIGTSIRIDGRATELYDTPPRDPVTFVATSALLLAMATLATFVPAQRALRANPADVLRAE